MIHATLQQLRLFEAVARNGSYTKAAQEVHLSQPAVSIQVKRLEEQIGQPLFEQIGKRIYLTAAGEELYSASTDIFERLALLESKLDALSGHVAGPLRVAVVTTAKYILPHYMAAFLRSYPDVEPHLKVTNRARVIERIKNNEDDLYVMGQVPGDLDVESTPFLEDQLAFFAHPQHPLAKRSNIPLEELVHERLLFREQGSGIRRAMELYFAEREITISPYMELGSSEAIKQAVMAGIGVGMLSIYTLRLEQEGGRIVILDVEGLPIRRSWNLVYRRGKHLPLVTQKFIEFLKESKGIPYGDELA